jgi:spermidine/putrescine transport system ATP-binding protein
MTVFENISFGPDMADWTREQTIERVEELADLLDIRHLLLRKISEVSGGEAQRVALARALATNPELLLLDEPLSALDLQLRERLQSEIRRIQRKLKITTIYVTHSQDEAFAISDRVAILDDGLVVQVGTPEELYDAPANEFVARFLGSGNVFSGRITEVAQQVLRVEVEENLFEIPGEGDVNSEIKFSVKPEDVIISDSTSKEWAKAVLVSITPQVGSFKVNLDFNGIPIIALTYDEDLVKRLRANGEKTIAFSFKEDSIIILSD